MSNSSSLDSLNDNEITKILGQTVDIKLKNKEQIITGNIFTLLKKQKILASIKN